MFINIAARFFTKQNKEVKEITGNPEN